MNEWTLEEFDALLEAPAEEEKSGLSWNNRSKKDLIVNVDVAARIASGETPQELAAQLGISMQTVKKYLRTAAMVDLVAIESRRIVRHLSKRDLKDVSYRDLAVSAGIWLDKERQLRDGVGSENRVVTQNIIDQINIFVSQRGNLSQGEGEASNSKIVDVEAIPDVPEKPDEGKS